MNQGILYLLGNIVCGRCSAFDEGRMFWRNDELRKLATEEPRAVGLLDDFMICLDGLAAVIGKVDDFE